MHQTRDRDYLNHLLEKQGCVVTTKQTNQLLSYVDLLYAWNQKINLSGISDYQEMLLKHVVDSLSVLNYLVGDEVLDVGTGGGLPGIPLSIMYPEKNFTLLDSNRKKQGFLAEVKANLALKNVTLACSRVEKYQAGVKFSSIVSRAFSSLESFVNISAHLLSKDGRLLAMRGAYSRDESLPKDFCVDFVQPLVLPVDVGQRHLVVIKRVS